MSTPSTPRGGGGVRSRFQGEAAIAFDRLSRVFTSCTDSSNSAPNSRPVSLQLAVADPRPEDKRSSIKLSELGTTVRLILHHPTLGPKFREFARARHAGEGIQFLDELGCVTNAEFKGESSPDAAQRLMSEYFMEGAPNWVNLSSAVQEDLLARLETNSTVWAMFQGVALEIISDLKHGDVFRDFCKEDEEAREFACNPLVYLVESWLASPTNFRNALIVFSHDERVCNLMRFCVSVMEYHKLSDKGADRKAKGNKIAGSFVQNGSRFQITDLAKLYADAILHGNYDVSLEDAKIECLRELTKIEEVLEFAKYTNSQDHAF